jgi:hypothetical protein
VPGTVDALFVEDGGRFVPSAHTGGPWSPDHQFGGAPAALVAQLVERVPTLVPMQVVRLTVDLLRPVPMRPLEVRVRVVREGKRIQALEASVAAEGEEVVRASALRFRVGDLAGAQLPTGQPRPGPPAVPLRPFGGRRRTVSTPGIATALEYAYERPEGIFLDPTWVRLALPLLAGEPTTPLARAAFLADCASGVGHPLDAGVRGINADIGLNVVRASDAEWLCIEGDGWTSPAGVGVAQARLSDDLGVVATATLSRLVDRTEGNGAPWRDAIG